MVVSPRVTEDLEVFAHVRWVPKLRVLSYLCLQLTPIYGCTIIIGSMKNGTTMTNIRHSDIDDKRKKTPHLISNNLEKDPLE